MTVWMRKTRHYWHSTLFWYSSGSGTFWWLSLIVTSLRSSCNLYPNKMCMDYIMHYWYKNWLNHDFFSLMNYNEVASMCWPLEIYIYIKSHPLKFTLIHRFCLTYFSWTLFFLIVSSRTSWHFTAHIHDADIFSFDFQNHYYLSVHGVHPLGYSQLQSLMCTCVQS